MRCGEKKLVELISHLAFLRKWQLTLYSYKETLDINPQYYTHARTPWTDACELHQNKHLYHYLDKDSSLAKWKKEKKREGKGDTEKNSPVRIKTSWAEPNESKGDDGDGIRMHDPLYASPISSC